MEFQSCPSDVPNVHGHPRGDDMGRSRKAVVIEGWGGSILSFSGLDRGVGVPYKNGFVSPYSAPFPFYTQQLLVFLPFIGSLREMVNWKSPEVIGRNALAFTKLIHVLLGMYCWEWFVSLDFDWTYLTGKKRFRWPLIAYFLNRYCVLFALIGITIALNVTTKIDCQALYTFNVCMGNFSIGLASVNFSIRTMAVWSKRWYIVVPLVLIILGHWSLLFHGILLTAVWDPAAGCVITSTDNNILSAIFIYSMCFDFTVLCLTGYKLSVARSSRLGHLMFADGLAFFLVAFLVNLIAVVFMLLNLNPIMSVIANVPAGVASSTVACRAVRRLATFETQGAEIYSSGFPRFPVRSIDPFGNFPKSQGVHIHTEKHERYEHPISEMTFKKPESDSESQRDISVE